MKYNLIDKITGETHLCSKITIDGFDYYVSNELGVGRNDFYYDYHGNIWRWTYEFQKDNKLSNSIADTHPKVIATNNPNIDIAKVINLVEDLSLSYKNERSKDGYDTRNSLNDFKSGYNKSQETHPFTEDDMIEFTQWCENQYFYSTVEKKWSTEFKIYDGVLYATKELLQLWIEQQFKTIYYG